MKRLALIMGRQGSGKSTRVCAELQRIHARRIRWSAWLPLSFRINIRPNYFNHMACDETGRLVLLTGMAHGRTVHALTDEVRCGMNALELPHTGYSPASVNAQLNNRHIRTHAFVIMLPEAEWRSYGGDVGLITSPEYFMKHGPLKAPRASVDYAQDCERTRSTIQASGVPATYYSSAREVIQPVIDFLHH